MYQSKYALGFWNYLHFAEIPSNMVQYSHEEIGIFVRYVKSHPSKFWEKADSDYTQWTRNSTLLLNGLL